MCAPREYPPRHLRKAPLTPCEGVERRSVTTLTSNNAPSTAPPPQFSRHPPGAVAGQLPQAPECRPAGGQPRAHSTPICGLDRRYRPERRAAFAPDDCRFAFAGSASDRRRGELALGVVTSVMSTAGRSSRATMWSVTWSRPIVAEGIANASEDAASAARTVPRTGGWPLRRWRRRGPCRSAPQL
jgi:hypothetical protein